MYSISPIKFIDQIALLCEISIFFESFILEPYVKSYVYLKILLLKRYVHTYIYIIYHPYCCPVISFRWNGGYFKSPL